MVGTGDRHCKCTPHSIALATNDGPVEIILLLGTSYTILCSYIFLASTHDQPSATYNVLDEQ